MRCWLLYNPQVRAQSAMIGPNTNAQPDQLGEDGDESLPDIMVSFLYTVDKILQPNLSD
jgi:hypothetical protein